MQWKNGDRVLALCPDEPYWSPGTVQRVEGGRAVVKCDDGSEYLLEPASVKALQIPLGTRVEGRWQGGGNYYPGTVTLRDGERVHVQYDDGDQEWTTLSCCRLDADAPPPASAADFRVGTRVEARWQRGATWYPGTMTQRDGERLHVQYDDGDQEWTAAAFVRPLGGPQGELPTLKVGDRVEARWQGGATWYPGTVAQLEGALAFIHYDDGDEEWLSPALCRKAGAAQGGGGAGGLAPGDRVEARWLGGATWYPGAITHCEGGRVHVHYDDGDEEWTTPALCRKVVTWKAGDRVLVSFRHDAYWYPGTVRRVDADRHYVALDNGDKQWAEKTELQELDIEQGDRVHCRRPDGADYVAGRVVRLESDRLLVQFEDGREGWAALALCRVTR